LDDLDVAPMVAGVLTEVSVPPPAGPGFELHRHRRAVAVPVAGADFFQDRFPHDLRRGLDRHVLLHVQRLHRLLRRRRTDGFGGCGFHEWLSLLDFSLALRSARALMRSSWLVQYFSKIFTQSCTGFSSL